MSRESLKEEVARKVEELFPEISSLSCWLYENPELPRAEYQAVEKITGYLAEKGFQIESGVAGLETAFVARCKIGEGGPRIGFLAEYDALPEVGHGCGHNFIAASCVGAAAALAQTIRDPAEIIVFGTPDEEYDGGKIIMAEAGVFRGTDAAMQIHVLPGTSYLGGSSTPHQTMVISFHGKPAHTAFNPTEGISALNAVLITFIGLNAMQQYLKPGTRIPATVTDGGGAPNIVPEFAQMRIHVTTLEPDYLTEVVNRIEDCARAGALATGARVDIWKGPVYRKLYCSNELTRTLKRNLEGFGFSFEDPPEASFATDVGNVSWECPTTLGFLSMESPDLPLHTKELAARTVSERGREILENVVKGMAATAVDLITDAGLLARIRQGYGETREVLDQL
jgi:amidohydrolase